ncbi:MAG TPA: hypothetical protein VMN58_03610 [Acidimicrobiales bacterium]|nr:hypothetical protein [Acidimicrobiales bacterium]
MPYESDGRFLALHVLRLKGFAEAAAVTTIAGVDEAEVERHLRSLAGEGLVLRREGRISGWSLTPDGRAAHAAAVAAELDTCGGREAVESAYRRFLDINQDMLATCTHWQLRDVDGTQVPNDHTDPVYDKEVIDRLVGIHDRVRPVTADLRSCMVRFEAYGRRLREALERVVAGEHEWFTKPVIDSYHTVWFEMHEDLLATLGFERTSEGSH